ncbi:MAG: HlyD family efflux transporter periplasmic adaptor subunit [Pirellulaceae bacterium]
MPRATIVDWNECTDFHTTLRMKTPAIVHATALLVVVMVTAAVGWMATTRANLVIDVEGRVRPVTAGLGDAGEFNEDVSSELGGTVVEVAVREDQQIRAGDVILRLDTARLENKIEQLRTTVAAGEEELEKMNQYSESLAEQARSERLKKLAELEAAREQIARAEERQASQIRLARLELDLAVKQENRARQLAPKRLISKAELQEAVKQAEEGREKLRQAQLPIERKSLEIARRAVEVAAKNAEANRHQLAMQLAKKQAEVKAAQLEMANLQRDVELSVVRAASAGLITAVATQVGDLLKPGSVGVTIASPQGMQFEALVPSAKVGRLKTGLASNIKLDAFNFQEYGILEGSLAEVAPDSNVTGTSDASQTAVYRVTISLPHDEVGHGATRGKIKLGMTGRAEIVTGNETILMIFVKKMREAISLS